MIRIGQGYDVHRLTEGRKLILCGVPVPHPTGLYGHSDADVAVHALIDAILGALALGDIGRFFPDTDPAYKDADSLKLLGAVMRDPRLADWRIGNIDLTIVALTGAVYHDVSKALYSAVPLYVSSVVMDGIIYGLDYSTVALIISERFEEIILAIEEKLDRGVTILEGRGGYSGEKKQVLLCAIRRRQAPQLKSIVREIDPEAFVILQEAHQVLGEGFRRNGDEM